MDISNLDLQKNKEIYGLILTAGYSSRMGTFKPLLPVGDITAIERIINTLREANVCNCVAVTGFKKELLELVLQRKQVDSTFNEKFHEGMFTSIKAGMRWSLSKLLKPLEQEGQPKDITVTSGVNGFLLMLVDCPLVPPEVIKVILEKHEEEPESFIVPCYRGKKGHPLFIPAVYADEILSYEGEGGLKAITNRYEEKLIRLEVDCEAVVLDMDTPEGYQEILEYYEKQMVADNKQKEGTQWNHLLKGKRLFLVRHGEIEQHQEKIFLGQRDVPLSEKGREQARVAALELKKYGINTAGIYTSDLCRASETAEIIADILTEQCIMEPSLREMSLGEWDGGYISEIKKQYPEEYKKRGENLLTYKYGNHSENFYDLQYRVMKRLENIVKEEDLKEQDRGIDIEDKPKDLLIVAHSGVIKVILSNLYGTDLLSEIEKPIPNGGITIVDFT